MEPRLYCDLLSAKMPSIVSDTAEHILSTQLLASLFPRRNTSKVRYFFSMLELVPALFSCGNSVSGTSLELSMNLREISQCSLPKVPTFLTVGFKELC